MRLARRNALLGFGALLLTGQFAAPDRARAWQATDISEALPRLAFTVTRASDAREVSAADYRGKIVLLSFGYTFCPDVCPATLVNVTAAMSKLGPAAGDLRVLFVTVDPNRDTLGVLRQYTQAFSPQIVGLRGTPDQLGALAQRYRVAYSVEPASGGRPYEVTHGSAVYVFDRNGEARLVLSGLASATQDLDGVAAHLRSLLAAAS